MIVLRYYDRESIQIRKLYPVSSSTLARLITQFSIVTYDVWQILVILVLVLNFFFYKETGQRSFFPVHFKKV